MLHGCMSLGKMVEEDLLDVNIVYNNINNNNTNNSNNNSFHYYYYHNFFI